jgi:tetratricopeptide (TPR) repeat protein
MPPRRALILQIAASLVTLVLFHWALFVSPPSEVREDGSARGNLSLEDARRLLEKADALMDAGKNAEALPLTIRLHDAFPESHIYLYHLATLYGRLSRPRDEADAWEKFMLVAPRPIEGCPALGEAYQKQGRQAESLDAFQRCLALDPADPDSLFFLGHAYERAGRLREAAETYERGLKLAPVYADLAIGLARVRLRGGQEKQAKADYIQIIRRWPDHADALLLGGLVLRAEGDLEGAKRCLRRGIERSKGYADFYIVLGGIAEQQNDVREAIHLYDKALELAPDDRATAQRRSQLSRGRS